MLNNPLSRRRFNLNLLLPAAAVPALAACGGRETPPQVAVPGAPKSGKAKALETGAALLQSKEPLDAMNLYLNGFHPKFTRPVQPGLDRGCTGSEV